MLTPKAVCTSPRRDSNPHPTDLTTSRVSARIPPARLELAYPITVSRLEGEADTGVHMHKCDNPSCSNMTSNPRFCSRSCSAVVTNSEHPRKEREGNCRSCGVAIYSCHRLCEQCRTMGGRANQTIEDVITRTGHRSSANVRVREHARYVGRMHNMNKCRVCGYTLHVEICHLTPISSYPITTKLSEVNNPRNLVALCPNHHWELDNGHLSLE